MERLKAEEPELKDTYQIGQTKVFMKEETRTGLELLLKEAVNVALVRIQSNIRGSLARIYTRKLREMHKSANRL